MKRKINSKGKNSRCPSFPAKYSANANKNCVRVRKIRLTAGGWAA